MSTYLDLNVLLDEAIAWVCGYKKHGKAHNASVAQGTLASSGEPISGLRYDPSTFTLTRG